MIAQTSAPIHSLKLKSRSLVAERTMELIFERPDGFTFKAGQFAELTLIAPPQTDDEGSTRPFSINSAPDDLDLRFATRLRESAFKRVLAELPPGTEVKVDGPFGDFTLHNDASRAAVLLAGGIGVTPFRSMVRWAAHKRLPHEILLFYSNRRPEDAPFLDELRELARANPNFKPIPTMTQMSRSKLSWNGEHGRIDAPLIQRHLKAQRIGLKGPRYYIAGPPSMLAGLHAMLTAAGIDDDDIRTEEFGGY
jgi:ferredoxin-NADP reductase